MICCLCGTRTLARAIKVLCLIKLKKSNLHYTRGITPKRVASSGSHLRGLASEQHLSEETSQRWRAVGDTQARREGGRSGHCPGARGHRGARGSKLSGLERKIHQLKLRPADAIMFFFYFGPKFEHLRTL